MPALRTPPHAREIDVHNSRRWLQQQQGFFFSHHHRACHIHLHAFHPRFASHRIASVSFCVWNGFELAASWVNKGERERKYWQKISRLNLHWVVVASAANLQ
jgi:hypothetical protein